MSDTNTIKINFAKTVELKDSDLVDIISSVLMCELEDKIKPELLVHFDVVCMNAARSVVGELLLSD